MRLWHKDLIPYLPRQQLIAQWRECCEIAGSIAKKGTPNHLLVNKILNYCSTEFYMYSKDIVLEMTKREYKVNQKSWNEFCHNLEISEKKFYKPYKVIIIFENWHNERYLLQCLANLSEKYDCGGIPEDEWDKIKKAFPKQIKILYNSN